MDVENAGLSGPGSKDGGGGEVDRLSSEREVGRVAGWKSRVGLIVESALSVAGPGADGERFGVMLPRPHKR